MNLLDLFVLNALSAFFNLRVHNVQEHSYHFDLFHQ